MVDRAGKVHMALDPDVSAAFRSRRAVRDLLDGEATAPFVDDAMLATSELVTNAVLHAVGPIELCARFDQPRGWLRVEVSDSSQDLPRPRAGPVRDHVGGLGLRLVAAISSSWGSVFNERGKTVWFELVEPTGWGA
jgi:anti-sigma regulatory factor (Ser/Thr protein kinase)